jgi:hypothetical protein
VDLSCPGGDGVSPCLPPSPTTTSVCSDPPSTACTTLPSAACVGFEILGACTASNDSYDAWAGTSYACPMVAGAAALLLAQEPSRGFGDVSRILESTADATALGAGYNNQTGWGSLDLYRALAPSASGFNAAAPALKLYSWPNPFNPTRQGLVHLTFYLDQPRSVDLWIYDAGGEGVAHWKLDSSRTVAGMNQVDWDGKNGVGRAVASGIYPVLLVAGTDRTRFQLAVLR